MSNERPVQAGIVIRASRTIGRSEVTSDDAQSPLFRIEYPDDPPRIPRHVRIPGRVIVEGDFVRGKESEAMIRLFEVGADGAPQGAEYVINVRDLMSTPFFVEMVRLAQQDVISAGTAEMQRHRDAMASVRAKHLRRFRGIVNGKLSVVNPDASDCFPWNRWEWGGSIVSVDGCSTADFTRADVIGCAVYCEHRESPSTGIAWLADGRAIGWEAWECTASTFSTADDIYVARTAALVMQGLSERSRDELSPLIQEGQP